jgi:plastocyanin
MKTSALVRSTAVLKLLTAGLSLALVLWCATAGQAQGKNGVVSGRVDLSGANPEEVGVVVYLESGAPESKPKQPVQSYRIRQTGKQFEPRLLVVPVGSTVAFPNEDHIFHNVFSLSSAERFDLGLYRSGTSKSVTFDREGAIDVYCNIHPEMSAQVLVLKTKRYAIVGKSGSFRIENVPPGSYQLVVWQRYQEPLRRPINVEPGRVLELSLAMKAGERPRRHTRKDGEPYGRYR